MQFNCTCIRFLSVIQLLITFTIIITFFLEEIPFEMGTHDRLLEENDLITNVLNQIPTEALNELFNG